MVGDRGERLAPVLPQRLDVLLEVLADAEGAPGAGEQHGAHGGVGGGLLQRVPQRLFGLAVEGVHCLGTVEGDRREAVGRVVRNGVGHGPSMAEINGREQAVRRRRAV